jgi:hypothetical protein
MKKFTVFLLFLFIGGWLSAATLNFQAPSFDEPHYRIQFRYEVKAERISVQEIRLNGEKLSSVFIFKEGKDVPPTTPLEKGIYDFVLDYAWAGGKSYQISLIFQPENQRKPIKSDINGMSPLEGGIPAAKEGFYRIYQVEEEIGLERKGEISTLTLTAPKSEIETGDFVIFDGSRQIPYQVLEKKESFPAEKASLDHPVTLTYKLALPLDTGAYEKKLILVLKGENKARVRDGFALSGEGLGKAVRGSKLGLEFHPQSGQINTIESFEAGIKLYNKAGVVHWNPDVFVPGIAWDHSFDWNPPLFFEDKPGGFLYLNLRKGPLPRIEGVMLEVKYTLEADAPYFVAETLLSFEKDLGVIAVRNDEMVLYRELFDSLMYKDKNQEIIKMPLQEKEGVPFGLVHIAPVDIDWAGLVNTEQGFGFFSLRLNSAVGNFETPGAFLHKPGTYFYAPTDGNYVYWVRPLIYTWADFTTNNFLTFVPKESFFYEKNAYVILRLSDDLPQKIDNLLKKLRNPLRVF